MPVDTRHLHAAVLLGREVPAERPDRGEREQVQPHEDVRTVQAGEPVEDCPLRRVVRCKAEVHVLVDLDGEEREPEQEGRQKPGAHPPAVLVLCTQE